MGRFYLSERNKDRTLNLLLVISFGLFTTGFIKSSVPKSTDPPKQSHYSNFSIHPISLGRLANFTYMEPVEDSGLAENTGFTSNDAANVAGKTKPASVANSQVPVPAATLIQPVTQLTQQKPVTSVLNNTLDVVRNLF